jgi:hypothetical protein
MIYSSRRTRRAKAFAEALALTANSDPPFAPHRARPILEAEEWLFESATEFCAALDRYAKRATQIKRVNHRYQIS